MSISVLVLCFKQNPQNLAASLYTLMPLVVAGVLKDALLLGHDTPMLRAMADEAGARLMVNEGDSLRLHQAAQSARGPWILCLEAGFVVTDAMAERLSNLHDKTKTYGLMRQSGFVWPFMARHKRYGGLVLHKTHIEKLPDLAPTALCFWRKLKCQVFPL